MVLLCGYGESDHQFMGDEHDDGSFDQLFEKYRQETDDNEEAFTFVQKEIVKGLLWMSIHGAERESSRSRSTSPPGFGGDMQRFGKDESLCSRHQGGICVSLINRKLDIGSPFVLHIEAVKDREEPISFGPDAVLVDYGNGWKLQTVTVLDYGARQAELFQRIPKQVLEVICKGLGKTSSFAAGTKAGFAVSLINRKLDIGSPFVLHIEAVKDREEPISFGPDAVLVDYGKWLEVANSYCVRLWWF
ncbi:maltase-glucoamylase, intestinal protein [Salix suchowensis]|nr:maltase-glucoamylase, intestinal protein [Salix suchowensis]